MANYFTWSSPNPVPAQTVVKGPHWTELGTNMRLLRGYVVDFKAAYTSTTMAGEYRGKSGPYTSAPYSWDANMGVEKTPVLALHMNDLRVALDDLNTQWTTYKPGWTWCTQYTNNESAYPGARITSGNIKIRNVHINELRTQLDLIDGSMKVSSPFCPTACQVACQLVCQSACQSSCQGCNNSTCHNQMCGMW